MKPNPYLTLATLVLGCGLAAAGLWHVAESAGGWQYLGYAGISLILLASATWVWNAGLFGPWASRHDDGQEGREIADLRRRLETQRQVLQDELQAEFQRLDKRERQLANRLVAFHQWSEFPAPIDVAESSATAVGATGGGATEIHSPGDASGDERLSELAEKDRRMLALLQSESERLFEDIRRNKYVVDGKFDATLVRDDAYRLVREVAAIYQGRDIENPLLQTSMSLVLRSASRVCLHFLVVLEQMPVRVQDYSIDRLYGYIRQGVKAYEMYKVAEPYWNNWIKPGFYLGRLAMGAHPLVLGAWWFVGALSTQGATALTTRIVNRQALALLYNVVRVIGFEVASMYGGQFRYRDANWIYAAELTEMLHCFTASRESLLHAMRELGALQLRNEYDRIHFYRCFAEHESAGPQRIAAAECLTLDQRRAVAHRLERFFLRFIKDRTPTRVRRWHQQVEQRLRVPLVLEDQSSQLSAREQGSLALESLAGFLLAVKQVEPGQLFALLPMCRLFGELPEPERENLRADWQRQPPLSFEPPELPERSAVARLFLHDLARLAVSVPPRDEEADALVLHTAAYLGRDESEMRKALDVQYGQQFVDRVAHGARPPRPPAPVARAVLDLLEEGERVRLLYGGARIESGGARIESGGAQIESPRSGEAVGRGVTPSREVWLLGTHDRLVAFSLEDTPRLVWRGDRTVSAERVRGYVNHDCRLRGGTWLNEHILAASTLRISGRLHRRFESYFEPLLEFCSADPVREGS